jgi:hypothetical protein
MGWLDAEDMVARLNRKPRGWANYFCLGPVTPAYRFIDRYTTTRLRRWLSKKHKRRSRGFKRNPDEYLYQRLGLICLPMLPQGLPWAKTCCSVREPDAGNPPVRFDDRDVKTELGSS